MKPEIYILIKDELKYLTNKNFSKKYITQYIIPIIDNINNSKYKKFIISGPQGSGKSTLAKLFKLVIEKIYKKKVMLLSIDDYYLSKDKRIKLSKKIHPLLVTRGVPGTHNIRALKNHIKDFEKQNFPISTPIFSKLKDDINARKKIIKNAQILFLEGWCCGSEPISKKFLFKNINSLEKNFDKNKIWRKFYNSHLKKEYKSVFNLFDKQIYIQVSSFKNILKWRYKQEKNNALKNDNKNFMNKIELRNFIKHYEKLTRWMIKNMPAKADMIIKIDNSQKINKLLIKFDSHQ